MLEKLLMSSRSKRADSNFDTKSGLCMGGVINDGIPASWKCVTIGLFLCHSNLDMLTRAGRDIPGFWSYKIVAWSNRGRATPKDSVTQT
jgi:hypothetical protein